LVYIANRGVVPIFHCLFSLDLNLIEALWNRMEDILEVLHPEVHKNSKRLRVAVVEAWEATTDAEVRDLVHTMHQRYQDVKDAKGMYTSW
jgi:hypothetical protein